MNEADHPSMVLVGTPEVCQTHSAKSEHHASAASPGGHPADEPRPNVAVNGLQSDPAGVVWKPAWSWSKDVARSTMRLVRAVGAIGPADAATSTSAPPSTVAATSEPTRTPVCGWNDASTTAGAAPTDMSTRSPVIERIATRGPSGPTASVGTAPCAG